MNTISRIYPHIFIDEIQDLASYDLEILKLLFYSASNVLLVCDPRQATYSTNNSPKYKRYVRSNIPAFFCQSDISNMITIDTDSLTKNFRSNQQICDFANKIFPNYSPMISEQHEITGHDGVFLIRERDLDQYTSEHSCCMQLRDNIKEKRVKMILGVLNFGGSKGRGFDRVLIYPTKPIIDWIKNNNSDLAPTSRSKFYVAVTRAKYSVGIVYNFKDNEEIEGTEKYQPNTVPS